jgi:PAS domain S-box-containing protein
VTGLVTSWNQGAERLYGYSAEEIVGRRVDVLVPPDHAGEPSAISARIQSGERVAAYETVRIAKDGRRIDVSLGISPLYEAGRIAGALVIVRNITEQKRIEAELAELKNQLVADLATMTRLQEISARLVQQKEMTQLLSEILDAAMAMTGADMGNIQLLDESSGVLAIKVQHGFDQAFLDFFARVHGEQAACGTALARGERIIVEDVCRSPIFAGTPALGVMLAAGARAVQSTPMVASSGRLVGVFSTHYRSARRPEERDLQVLDLLARQAADLIERVDMEQALRVSEARFQAFMDHSLATAYIKTREGRYIFVNRMMQETFGITVAEWIGRTDFELFPVEEARQWRTHDLQVLESGTAMEVDETVHQTDGVHHYLSFKFPLDDSSQHRLLGGMSIDVTRLNRMHDELEQGVAERTKWLTLVHDIGRTIDEASNWNEALHLVMRRICDAEGWQAGYVYLPAADDASHLVVTVGHSPVPRFAPFDAASQGSRHARGHFLPGRVFDAGRHVWINDRDTLLTQMPLRAEAAALVGLRSVVALPVRIGDETVAVVELCSDQPHPEREELLQLMQYVSAQIGWVIERERALAQVSEIIWNEQQDLAHTLHDALGQQLTGLGMLAASLTQRIADTDTHAAIAQTAHQIARAAQDALERVRELSRGLFHADIDGKGFVQSLRQLASTTEALHTISCSLECEGPIAIPNGRAATHLYRIAQEAVTNALRHAEATRIVIGVRQTQATTTVTVADNGVGIHSRVSGDTGIGLRIMRHRAMSIGAVLSVGPGSAGGTVVTCTLHESGT